MSKRTRMAVGSNTSSNELRRLPFAVRGSAATSREPPPRTNRQIREELRARGVTVIEIPNLDLADRAAMPRHFKRLGRSLGGREYGQQVAEDAEWFETN